MSENTPEVAFEKKTPRFAGSSPDMTRRASRAYGRTASRPISSFPIRGWSPPAVVLRVGTGRLHGEEDMGNRILGLRPPGRVRFMFSELGPGDKTKPRPPKHKTDTIDFKS